MKSQKFFFVKINKKNQIKIKFTAQSHHFGQCPCVHRIGQPIPSRGVCNNNEAVVGVKVEANNAQFVVRWQHKQRRCALGELFFGGGGGVNKFIFFDKFNKKFFVVANINLRGFILIRSKKIRIFLNFLKYFIAIFSKYYAKLLGFSKNFPKKHAGFYCELTKTHEKGGKRHHNNIEKPYFAKFKNVRLLIFCLI